MEIQDVSVLTQDPGVSGALEAAHSRGQGVDRSLLIAIPLLLGLAVLQVVLGDHLLQSERRTPSAPQIERAKREPELYRVLSFGHLPSTVDWIWIKSLTETELIRPKDESHGELFYDLDLLTDLDPLFAEVYVAGANLLAVVQNDGHGAKGLLDKAERFRLQNLDSMPESYRSAYWAHPWQVPLLLAYVHLFELNNMPAAASYFVEAAGLPEVPPYVIKLKARLEKPDGEYEVGAKLLEFLMGGAADPKIRERLETKHRYLKIAWYLHDLNMRFSGFLKKGGSRSHLRPGGDLSPEWKRFREEARIPPEDPWGGALSVEAASGKVVSTTPHERVLGLD